MDFKAGGTLCHILGAAYKYKNEQGWRRFDLQNPSRMDRNVEMFMTIEKTLVQNNCLSRPTIYLIPDMELKLANKLKDIVKRHQGTVTEEKSKATHHVYPSPTSMDDDEWLRPVMKKDKQVLVHWGFFPDSYDTWVHANEIDAEIEDPPIPEKPWKVHAKWILDTDVFNEWMNEEDYEVDENRKSVSFRQRISMKNEEPVRSPERRDRKAAASTRKRKHSPSPPPTPVESRKKTGKKGQAALYGKRRGQKEEDEQEDLTKDMEDPTPVPNIEEVVLPKNVNPKKDSENTPVKGGTVADLDEQDEETVATGGKEDEDPNKGDQSRSIDPGEDNVTEQTNHIIIPSYASWFDYNCIHVIERRALPEFFNGKNKSKTPEIAPAWLGDCRDPLVPLPAIAKGVCSQVQPALALFLQLAAQQTVIWGFLRVTGSWSFSPGSLAPVTVTAGSGALLQLASQQMSPVSCPCSQVPAAQQMLSFPEKNKEKPTDLQNFGLRTDIYSKKTLAKAGSKGASAGREWTEQETLLLLEAPPWCFQGWLFPLISRASNITGTLQINVLQSNKWIAKGCVRMHSCLHPAPAAVAPPSFSVLFLLLASGGLTLAPAGLFLVCLGQEGEGSAPGWAGLGPTAGTSRAQLNPKQRVGSGCGGNSETFPLCLSDGAEEEKMETEAEGQPAEKVESKAESETEEGEKVPEGESERSAEKEPEGEGAAEPRAEEKEAEENKENVDGSKDKEAEAGKKKVEHEISEGNVATAAAAALASAATKAKHLAAVEERKIKSLVALLVETQMKKLEIKLRHFEELETIMDREKEALEQQRQQLLTERQNFHMEQLKYAELRARQQLEQQHSQTPQQPHQHPSGPGITPLGAPAHPGLLPHQQPPPYPMMHHQMPPPHPPQPGQMPGPGSMMPGQPMPGRMMSVPMAGNLLGPRVPLAAPNGMYPGPAPAPPAEGVTPPPAGAPPAAAAP
ncbi:SMRC1 protein, partial [Erithacus rubecula]|nr:SMRC1 protein [Erithacus rubecula]